MASLSKSFRQKRAPMATDDEIRAWARGTGHEVGERGRLTNALKAEYMLAHGGAQGGGEDVTAAEPDPDAGPGTDSETVPRRVTKPRAPGKSLVERALSGRAGAAKRKRKPRKNHGPRRPVTSMVTETWHEMADLFQGVPPMYRLMRVQAPYAGSIVEDTVRGTVADKVFQPVVRVHERSRKVTALGAPVFVAGMMLNSERQDGAGFQFAAGALRYSLKCWLREEKLHAEEVIEQAEKEDELNAEVEQLFRYIFGMPAAAPPVADGVVIGQAS